MVCCNSRGLPRLSIVAQTVSGWSASATALDTKLSMPGCSVVGDQVWRVLGAEVLKHADRDLPSLGRSNLEILYQFLQAFHHTIKESRPRFQY